MTTTGSMLHLIFVRDSRILRKKETSSTFIAFTNSTSSTTRNGDTTVARLLEFGGGPVIVPLISAVPFVSEIMFCEYSESGRKEVQTVERQ